MFKKGDRVVSLTTLADSLQTMVEFGMLGTVMDADYCGSGQSDIRWDDPVEGGPCDFPMVPYQEIMPMPCLIDWHSDGSCWKSPWDDGPNTGYILWFINNYYLTGNPETTWALEFSRLEADGRVMPLKLNGVDWVDTRLPLTATAAEREQFMARAWAHVWRGLGVINVKN